MGGAAEGKAAAGSRILVIHGAMRRGNTLRVPGHVKAWLDHMSYCFHRPAFFTKKAMVISTTAGQGADAITKYLHDVLMH